MDNNLSYVRTEMLQEQTPPLGERGIIRWMRINLFATPMDTALTVFALLVIAWFLPGIINWLFVNAVWSGPDRSVCSTVAQGGIQPEGWSGACWAYVNANFSQFMYGPYPIDQHWRVNIVAILFVLLLVPLLIPKAPYKVANAIVFFFIFPIVAFFLLVGGWFGLPYVETANWGGLLVTLTLSFVGISVSLPLGIALALGRRSKMPVIKMLCVIFIETIRGIPLITVLFMASYMLPLFLPPGVSFDKYLRALIGVALFASAYMAEVVRGGLQAIPKGQYEGADSLGLSYWQKTGLIILPQALKLVIPGIVNTFIGLFKDTSLVTVISMFDLLGTVKQHFADANWASPQTPISGLIFAGFVFWIFCFGMSRYSIFMEKRLDKGHKR
ncbi:general L-amino acid ABC transporter membrane protein [Phyllobacterium sp. YR620]|uniref:Amino acid ABC transporter permease n=1 Tax=Phyllobacterium pellucidum TaxID=2740464 RepID=A0A849VLP2_9HYPH|nr:MULTISPECIES: amino acid ABC transporter permease [Phyllobacterium]MRG55753.1 ABC transporter permease subunit [Phyllobacterium sp. SYP-B3895]NTS29964.1 amino acid ABC transporter permease [Phyllobacterium pellucidum]UGY08223.1 amino acid ABC transporter permease [Phyllobacterium sp. T1018]SDP58378.1 general L-amino acid ABC transporter membrane protein [Phyllobacterium sp. YR620]SFI48189.1 general L-amino acid ABC transporter membrane protein [Phyllobacterium sp. CL33Tsu]